jgi:hypothetical protein
MNRTYLVEFVAEVYWIDVVALQVRKHNDLLLNIYQTPYLQRAWQTTYEENHAKQ